VFSLNGIIFVVCNSLYSQMAKRRGLISKLLKVTGEFGNFLRGASPFPSLFFGEISFTKMDTSGRVMPVWPITLVSPWRKKRNLYTPRSALTSSFNCCQRGFASGPSSSCLSMNVLVRYSKETAGNAPRKIKGIVTIYSSLHVELIFPSFFSVIFFGFRNLTLSKFF